ncbi:peptide chain release factor N(5)-glutamine methyltransferase [Pectinatus cerevisiiphilus]|uniref:Release factor glutamine methyltransferase n=1 Tax=Pectinatus cerevisiiphilus TaxID=86956 RepID=A0A4R3K7A4_9FIRM|nr:peptide chain release factor N(5)-glutamine methyltransferase [Pectinatus cerevisiiphilus]TCS78725.1 release factor glutamine methyltransferase [Pectinatus cerevisiiphilus]
MTQNKTYAGNGKIWTIGTILKWTQEYFSAKGIDSPRLDAEVLLSYLLGKERIYLYVHFDEPLQENELIKFRELVKKRAARIPVAYLTGQKEFMGMPFKVNRHVLVPRPETELLVECAIERLPSEQTAVFADIGTGSGAIAISLVKLRKNLHGYAVDISAEAIAAAQENAGILHVEDKIEFLQGDLLQPLRDIPDREPLAAIVANPPYIPLADMDTLEPEVRAYEPADALTDGADGLNFYRRLLEESKELLVADGFLACEIGIKQAASVKKIAAENAWGKIEILKDLAGIERVVVLWKQK